MNLNLEKSPKGIYYFDKFCNDYDRIRQEFKKKIEFTFNEFKREELSPPEESHEIIPILPNHLNFIKLNEIQEDQTSKKSRWNILHEIFDEEVIKNQRLWESKNKDFSTTWNNIQDILSRCINNKLNQLKYNNTIDHDRDHNHKSKQPQLLKVEDIIYNPGLLENLSINQLYLQQKDIESQLNKKCKDLTAAYEKDLENFLNNWLQFRISFLKFGQNKELKLNQAIEDRNGELLALDQQYVDVEKWFKINDIEENNKTSSANKEIKINIRYGTNYSTDTITTITPQILNMTIHEWSKNIILTKYGSSTIFNNGDNYLDKLQTIISGGPAMKNNLRWKHYNIQFINLISIIVVLPSSTTVPTPTLTLSSSNSNSNVSLSSRQQPNILPSDNNNQIIPNAN